jgi:hypothetical protein
MGIVYYVVLDRWSKTVHEGERNHRKKKWWRKKIICRRVTDRFCV